MDKGTDLQGQKEKSAITPSTANLRLHEISLNEYSSAPGSHVFLEWTMRHLWLESERKFRTSKLSLCPKIQNVIKITFYRYLLKYSRVFTYGWDYPWITHSATGRVTESTKWVHSSVDGRSMHGIHSSAGRVRAPHEVYWGQGKKNHNEFTYLAFHGWRIKIMKWVRLNVSHLTIHMSVLYIISFIFSFSKETMTKQSLRA